MTSSNSPSFVPMRTMAGFVAASSVAPRARIEPRQAAPFRADPEPSVRILRRAIESGRSAVHRLA